MATTIKENLCYTTASALARRGPGTLKSLNGSFTAVDSFVVDVYDGISETGGTLIGKISNKAITGNTSSFSQSCEWNFVTGCYLKITGTGYVTATFG